MKILALRNDLRDINKKIKNKLFPSSELWKSYIISNPSNVKPFKPFKHQTFQTFQTSNFSNMTINQLQDNIIEDFSQFDDWMDKYSLLIDLGNSLEPLDEKQKNPQNIIEGCQSRVWLDAEIHDGIITYKGESDAILVKGLVSLLIQVMSGHTPDEIINTELYFIDKIGLREHLSPTRSNGLLAMVKQMKMFALAYKAKGS